MRAQVVPDGEVPPDIMLVVCLEDVYLVGALVAALSQVAPAGDAELSQIFIANPGEVFRKRVHGLQALDGAQDVKDRLG